MSVPALVVAVVAVVAVVVEVVAVVKAEMPEDYRLPYHSNHPRLKLLQDRNCSSVLRRYQ